MDSRRVPARDIRIEVIIRYLMLSSVRMGNALVSQKLLPSLVMAVAERLPKIAGEAAIPVKIYGFIGFNMGECSISKLASPVNSIVKNMITGTNMTRNVCKKNAGLVVMIKMCLLMS